MLDRTAAAATVALLGALTVWWGPAEAGAAQAAGACSGRSGVTVVVDFGPLGGGTDVGCVSSGGGRSAATVTESSGHPITRVNNQAFVCKISGLPESEDCANTPPDNAYWGLFWSDGTSGWHYSTQGAYSLTVKDGWSVGWRFQNGGAQDQPSAGPRRDAASPSPTPRPSSSPTRKPSPRPTAAPSSAAPPAATAPSSAAGVPAATASRRPPASRRPAARPSPSATPSESPTEDPSGSPSEDPTDEPSDEATAADGPVGTVTGSGDARPGNDTGVAAVAGLGGLAVLAGSAAVVAYRRGRS